MYVFILIFEMASIKKTGGRRAYVTTDSAATLDRYGRVPRIGASFVLLKTGRIGLVGLGLPRTRRDDATVADDVAGELSRWLPAGLDGPKVSLSTLMSADGGKLFCEIETAADSAALDNITRFNKDSLAYRRDHPQLALFTAADLFGLLDEEATRFETMRKWQAEQGFASPLTTEQRMASDVYAKSNGLEPLFHADARYFALTLKCLAGSPAMNADGTPEWSFMVADTKRTVTVDPTVADLLRVSL